MDIVSFIVGFVSAIAVLGVTLFAVGIAAYNKQQKAKKESEGSK